MAELPDGAIDLIFAGPPYGSLINYSSYAAGEQHYKAHSTDLPQYITSFQTWFSECFRVLRAGRYCIVNLGTIRENHKTIALPFYAVSWLEELGFSFQFEIVWDKIVGGRHEARNFLAHPFPGRFTPNNRVEYLLFFKKNPRKAFAPRSKFYDANIIPLTDLFKREIANNVWHVHPATKRSSPDVSHPCPFPPEIPERIITYFSFPQETVLDPFMGSGSTAIAAKKLGRYYVGYETEDRFRIDAERLIAKYKRKYMAI
nr:site-specific DNA-methyltransferase [Fundidesulfovibrio soli]